MDEKKYLLLNWKTNPLSSLDLISEMIAKISAKDIRVTFFPPPFYLGSCQKESLSLGVSHVDLEPIGAATGSLSLDLACQIQNVELIMVGHAEVRQRGLSQDFCEKMIKAVLEKGKTPVFCFGEDKDQNFDDLLSQLALFKNLPVDSYILAYEPVWAIGTGLRPSLSDIESRMSKIRQYLGSDLVRVCYGGSIDSSCFDSFFNSPFISGLLLGKMSRSLDVIYDLLGDKQ